ncbi:unnamed protein product [Cylicocyclus nassatus]|uniref:Uncharacterized protein n=1 Tax=Cylicocyclus nassatus TaxID=53992 RepID=A0AA36MAT1_CYLNA|nr:unnamed protein product [Cylicocyclus nassatus]
MLVFQNLSSATKRELVTFINEIRGDYVELSAQPSETIEIIRQRLPELGKNINTALNKLIKTIRKLPASSKEAFQKYWIIFFESLSAPTPLRSMFLAAFFAELHDSFKKAEDSTLVEIYKASPQTFRLLRSDFTKEFAYAAKKYARRDLKMKAPLDEQDGF